MIKIPLHKQASYGIINLAQYYTIIKTTNKIKQLKISRCGNMKMIKFRKKRFPFTLLRFFRKAKKSKSDENSDKIVNISDYKKSSSLSKKLEWLDKHYLICKL